MTSTQEPSEDDTRETPDVIDRRVAANVRLLREKSGMTLEKLSAKLAPAWNCSPQILNRIELGQRKLSPGEAATLARALGVPYERLMRPEAVAGALEELRALSGQAEEAHGEIVTWVRQLELARANLQLAAGTAKRLGLDADETVRAAVQHAVAVLEYATAENAAAAGAERFRDDFPALAGGQD